MGLKNEISFSGETLIKLIKATLEKKANFRFQVKGSSMSPFIKDSDVVTLSAVSRSQLVLGKPVACVSPTNKKLLVHRIIARKGKYYLVKGDNCRQPDRLIHKEDILGCVTSIERQNKTIRFSLGFEGAAVAFLSRNDLLPLFFVFWRLIPTSLRRFIKCGILL